MSTEEEARQARRRAAARAAEEAYWKYEEYQQKWLNYKSKNWKEEYYEWWLYETYTTSRDDYYELRRYLREGPKQSPYKPGENAYDYGAEFIALVGAGVATVECCDEQNRRIRAEFRKGCFGPKFSFGFSAHVLQNVEGKDCPDRYEGGFWEVSLTVTPWGGDG